MKSYTEDGGGGQTTGRGGARVSKSDVTCRALGSLDELNSHVGLCLAACSASRDEPIDRALRPIQPELLALGAMLAGAGQAARDGARVDPSAVGRLQEQLDAICAELGDLTSFILPGGCELTCRLHVARTVCRRAERAVVAWTEAGLDCPPHILQYVNRLSDLLFALARLANRQAGVEDRPWRE